MKYKYFVVVVVLGFTSLFSQTRYQFEVDLGMSFQSKIKLDDQILAHSNTFTIRFGANVQIPVYQDIYVETGVFGKYNRGSDEIEIVAFDSESLRLQIPLYVGYKINDKWKTNLGVSIENNRDFDKIDFQKEHNLRYDFLTKLIYQHTDQIHYVFYSNWSLSKVSDYYNISNPKNGLFLGVIYQLKKKQKKESDEK